MKIDVIGFILGIWQEVIATGLVALVGWFCLWFRSRTFIKNDEYNRLKGLDAEYLKCEAKNVKLKSELDGLRETCAPYLEQKRRELLPLQRLEESEKPRLEERRLSEALRPIETNTYFDPRVIVKKIR